MTIPANKIEVIPDKSRASAQQYGKYEKASIIPNSRDGFRLRSMCFRWGVYDIQKVVKLRAEVGHCDDKVIFLHPSFRTRAQTRAENIPRKALKTINCENSTSALNKTPNPASVVSFPNFIIILQSTIETASFRIDSPNTFSLI